MGDREGRYDRHNDRRDRRSFRPDDRPPQQFTQAPRPPEEVLGSQVLQLERKTISITARRNSRGSFIRIIEESGSTRSSVIIPDSGVHEFMASLHAVTTQAGL